MAEYKKKLDKRSDKWNYGGSEWKLSRSKLELFMDCPLCFYVDNKLGVGRPPGFPFNLNSAVDILLKKEFDIHRAAKSTHPLMKAYGLDAIPFANDDMDIWRETFKGIEVFHEKSGLIVKGAVDDLWINPKGELIVVDYKSTSKETKISLDAEWQDGYKRQMEIYQWLLRRKGFKVSDTGYFVYANGLRDRKAFDGKLEFEVTLIPYTGKDTWVEKAILEAKKCLDNPTAPEPAKDCEYCAYRRLSRDVQAKLKPAKIEPKAEKAEKISEKKLKVKSVKNEPDHNKTESLF